MKNTRFIPCVFVFRANCAFFVKTNVLGCDILKSQAQGLVLITLKENNNGK